MSLQIIENLIQGSQEWLSFRKNKITATDASVIMNANPWKTRQQLYEEKTGDFNSNIVNEKMQRGIDLEPIARELFTIQTGIKVKPKVAVKDWAMASLDGISDCGKHLVEIKCPSETHHMAARHGGVPSIYCAQLQHQMYVCDLENMHYFSFDGLCGICVKVNRDDKYIEKMIEREKEFYDHVINKNPLPDYDEYLYRTDEDWIHCANKWKQVTESIKKLEQEEIRLRENLIQLSNNVDCKGGGISLCQIERKGNIDYSKIPELKNIDLEQYRKPITKNWRLTCL